MNTKHDVMNDVWQMNLFVTLQVCQNLSNFSYLVAEFSSPRSNEDLIEEEEESPALARFERRRLSA